MALICCKPSEKAPTKPHKFTGRWIRYRPESLTIRLDSLGIIDSSTARFVEAIRRRFNIDSNKIKYEIRNTQH